MKLPLEAHHTVDGPGKPLKAPSNSPRASVVSAEALGHFQGLPDLELGRYM